MKLQIALEILKQHNLWRRDKEVPSTIKMHSPADIGVAIDTVIESQSELLRQNREMKEALVAINTVAGIEGYSAIKSIVKDCLTSCNKGKE